MVIGVIAYNDCIMHSLLHVSIQLDNLKKNFDDAEERRLVVDEEFVTEFDLEEGGDREGQLRHQVGNVFLYSSNLVFILVYCTG